MLVERNRVPWLDFCRALAISLVLFGHGKHFLLPYFPWIKYFPVGGFLGVELFFVLSGFLIGSIIINANRSSDSHFGWIPEFWGRRWLRTLPNYYFFLVINITLLDYGIRPVIAESYVPYFFFYQNLAWPHPAFFGEAWSLAVEEIFYLLTPIIIGLFSMMRKSKDQGLLITVVLLFTASLAAKFIYVWIYDPSFDGGVRKIVLFRLDALMVGVFFAWIAASLTEAGKKISLKRIGVFLLPLFFAQPIFSLTNGSFDQSYFARTLLFPITSIGCIGLILFGIHVTFPKWLAWISSMIASLSYSAYLVNLPLLSAIELMFAGDQLAGYIKFAIYVVLTFSFSFVTYRLIEMPVLRFRDRAIPGGRLSIIRFDAASKC